jgi:hypothetical protein
MLTTKYLQLCRRTSDINEHLSTLSYYASKCESVFETGVRGCVSSWAFVDGLMKNDSTTKKLFLNDIDNCDIDELLLVTKDLPIEIKYEWKNNLELNLNETFDLTFIDTWHVYGQLKRELSKFSHITNKYIIMHDTTVDEWFGETIRCGWNAEEQSKQSGFSVEEINKGLWPAITEFLEVNPEWVIEKRYTNNNGLTILRRLQNLFPITFSIPKEKIINEEEYILKTKLLSDLIPGVVSTYIYNTEEAYYNEYRLSYFALTKKKGGWDCLRHYEILANGCIPVFESIDKCPKYILSLLPKDLLKEGNKLYDKLKTKHITQITTQDKDEYYELRKKLLQYTKQNLTTERLAHYILIKIKKTETIKILYLSKDTSPDYLRCLTLHGLKTIFGENIHDYPKISHLYKSSTIEYNTLYGRGITYTNLLDPSFRNENLDDDLLNLINQKYFDLIIYGSYHRGMIYQEHVMQHYKPDEIVLLCGEDDHLCNYKEWVDKGYNVFVRELV